MLLKLFSLFSEERNSNLTLIEFKDLWRKPQASSYVKYLGIYLDEYHDWSPYINHLSHKLVKANAMLCKLRML